MAVTLGKGIPTLTDGQVIEDFELLAVGTLTSLPALNGVGGCSFGVGTPAHRTP